MPELPEVHRAAHFLRTYLVAPATHTLSKASYYSPPNNSNAATQTNDPKIFDTAKTGTDAASFSKALQGKKIQDVGRLGKYFWLEMESPPHPLFHFGMTGWIKYKGTKGKGVDYWQGKVEGRAGAKGKKKEDVNGEEEVQEEEWPPKFTKMLFEATSESGDVTEFAFVDGRRFAKIVLVNPESGKSVRDSEPLVQNGADPVLEADKITAQGLKDALSKKKVPIKAYLLDQHNLSGVGNWVADEILFHAGIHPEAVANSLDDEQVGRLVEKVKEVCKVAAIDALGDSHKFPDDWLMRHRWQLDKTGGTSQLPSGEKIVKITVGGRTSAVVPSRQGKSAGSKVGLQENGAGDTAKGKGRTKRKIEDEDEDDDDDEEAEAKEEDEEEIEEYDDEQDKDADQRPKGKRDAARSGGRTAKGASKRETASSTKKQKTGKSVSDMKGSSGTRRSARGGQSVGRG